MADDTDQLVISISADTSQIDRAINRLLGSVNSSTRGIATAFSRAGDAMDSAGVSATKLQQQINALTGVNSSMKSRADDVAAYGAQLDALRAKYNPLFGLSKQYEAELEGINKAAKVGAITSAEQAAAIDDLNDRYTTAQAGAKGLATAHGGLSTQAMAAQHSVRSLVEQLALGVPPSQALLGQFNHLSFAASGEGGLAGAFKEAAAPLAGLLTASTVTFGGIAVAIGGAALALNGYLTAQQKVQASVLGAGRASGATSSSINTAASQGSSAFGLSVSEARDLASALASTGKVANDNILPIVKMGHDISIAFGTDAKGATELLAKAFADPIQGADELNRRLGFLDAATKQNIANLVAQNNIYGAQQVLLKATQSSLAGFAATQDNVSKGWAAIGNAASNAWGSVGKFFANALGLGQSLEDRLAAAQDRLNALKTSGGTTLNLETGIGFSGGDEAVQKQQKEVDDLTAAIQRNAVASINAAAAQKSFSQQSTVRDLTPEIAQQEALNNQLKVLQSLFDQLSNSEAAGEILKRLGISFEQLAAAMKKASSEASNFKSSYQQAIDSQKIQLQSITAFSPNAKGDIAYQQALNEQLAQRTEYTKAAALADGARTIAIKQATTALSEQARAQILSSKQSVDSAQLDIDLIGKSIEQQALLRANLASRQQLEQTASQNRTAFNEAEYQQLVKNNAEAAKRAQISAQLSAQDSANFSVQTAFFSDIDQQIASVQKQLHGNAWPQYMNDGLAATMRIADGLKQLSSLGQDVTRGVFTDFETQIRNGASAMDALKTAGVNALGKISDKLAGMAADQLWVNAFGGTSSTGLLGKLFGIGGASGASTGLSLSGTGGLFDAGGYTGQGGKYVAAGIVHKGEYVFDQDSVRAAGGPAVLEQLRKRLRGYADGGYVGMPSIPSVVGNTGGAVSVSMPISIDARGADGAGLAVVSQQIAQLKAELPTRVVAAVKDAKARRVLA